MKIEEIVIRIKHRILSIIDHMPRKTAMNTFPNILPGQTLNCRCHIMPIEEHKKYDYYPKGLVKKLLLKLNYLEKVKSINKQSDTLINKDIGLYLDSLEEED